MSEWWISGTGVNMLKGVEDDTTNLPRLRDEVIVDFLRRIPAARDSFNRLYPTMLPEEKERLDRLSSSAFRRLEDTSTIEDRFQKRLNSAPIRTTGPRGGTRVGR